MQWSSVPNQNSEPKVPDQWQILKILLASLNYQKLGTALKVQVNNFSAKIASDSSCMTDGEQLLGFLAWWERLQSPHCRCSIFRTEWRLRACAKSIPAGMHAFAQDGCQPNATRIWSITAL